MKNQVCTVFVLGKVPYSDSMELQTALAHHRAKGLIGDTLLLLEHPHIYTIGRRGNESDILISQNQLSELNIEVSHVDRGGQVTYHGPGQLVGYPILDLHNWGGPVRYVRAIESALIGTLQSFGVPCERVEGETGVWVPGQQTAIEFRRKIASIGLRISRGISAHGFALNINPDLSFFDHIIPCGIRDHGTTSIAQELGQVPKLAEIQSQLVKKLEHHLERQMSFGTNSAIGVSTI